MCAMRAPHEPVEIYQSPQLRSFQGWSLLALIAVCVGIGFAAGEATRRVWMWWQQHSAAQMATAAQPTAGNFRMSGKMHGLGNYVFPPQKPVVMNVWLENCADCMGAFAAWKSLRSSGAFPADVDVVNVAYGSASQDFAQRYSVNENVVFDAGNTVVQPLGIGTFTTFVVDERGFLRFRARPTDPGFADRLRGTLDALITYAPPPAHTATSTSSSPLSSP